MNIKLLQLIISNLHISINIFETFKETKYNSCSVKKKKVTRSNHKWAQVLNLSHIDLKAAIINLFMNLKETIFKLIEKIRIQ